MLKWTVKKRLDDQQQQFYQFNDEDDDEHFNKLYKPINTRRSLGNVLAQNTNFNSPTIDQKYHKRRSLGNQLIKNSQIKFDKENQISSTPINNHHSCSLNRINSTPLNDCSNVHRNNSNKRKREIISSTSIASPLNYPMKTTNINEIYVDQPTIMMAPLYAPTLPSFDVEYSPVMKQPAEQLSTIKKISVANLLYENSRYFGTTPSATTATNTNILDELPSKRQKTNLLDFSYEFKPELTSTSSPLSTPLTTRKTKIAPKLLLDTSTSSNSTFNSSAVGDVTLEKMIDAILVSAKNGKKFRKHLKNKNNNNNNNINNRDRNLNFMKTLNEACEQSMEQKNIECLLSPNKLTTVDQTIIITENNSNNVNEREVKSPAKSCDEELEDLRTSDTCQLKRQKGVRRKNNSNENKLKKRSEEKEKIERDLINCSTQKCLSFSSANYEDISEKFKRSSVASNSSTSSASTISLSKYTKNLLMKGSLEMTIFTDENRKKIIVHVVKCKNLQRASENHQVNAYVKCAMVSTNVSQNLKNSYQRTAVHRNSISPVFDHKFTFKINDFGDYAKRIQLAVWHRNKEIKKSEFLGCISIPVKNIIEKSIHGCFLLQPQICLTNPSTVIPENEKSYLNKKIESVELNMVLPLNPTSIKNKNNVTNCYEKKLIETKNQTPSSQSIGFTIVWTKTEDTKDSSGSSDILDFII